MKSIQVVTIFVLMFHSAWAHAQSAERWFEKYEFDCNGPYAHFEPSELISYEGFDYSFSGATVKIRRSKATSANSVSFGLLSGIKDFDPETKALLDVFLASFEKKDVEAIVIGGDTSSEPDLLDSILGYILQSTKRPVLIVAGNMERGAMLNHAISKSRAAGKVNAINMGIIRRYDGPGADLVSLSGYHDKSFLHLAGGCLYTDKDISNAERAIKEADDAVVFLSHGPLRQKGPKAIDYVPGADNVGDTRLTKVFTDNQVRFGISGHILEAGGMGTDAIGKSVPEGKFATALFVDQGSANPLPWKLNDGKTAYGLAAILTVEGNKAKYQVLRGEKPRNP
jgi:Icc-related predicted phosphoesterase